MPEPEKLDIPPPVMEPPAEPQMEAVEPAPDAVMPKFDVQKEKPAEDKKTADKKKPAPVNFNDLLNKLTAPERPVKNAKAGPRVIQGIGAGNAMTADIADALKGQIYRCWSPPTGAPDARDLVVDYDLRLNPDGTVGGLRAGAVKASVAEGEAGGFQDSRQRFAGRAVHHGRGDRVERRRLAVDDHQLGARANGGFRDAGRGVDDQRRADHDH